ncbi:MAG: Xaa-Pro peptidase family protein [Acidobacteriota bacterium]
MGQRRPPAWAGRLHKLQSSLRAQSLDAFVVSTPHNVRYLTGFAGSTSLVVVVPSAVFLVSDGRYAFAVQEALGTGTIGPVTFELVDRRYDLTLASLLARQGVVRAAFEAGHVTVATLSGWQRAAPAIEWVSTERVVESARAIKDAGEVAIFRRAGALLASVAGRLRDAVVPGRQEIAVAEVIDKMIIAAGFSRPAFETIVASGPNSAHPHARPTERRLTGGDLVVLDFGGVLDGYCVDLTRMAAVGAITSEAAALFAAVRDAHAAALGAVRPGVETSAIDAAARQVLEAQGLGEAFMHSTGHGLGLEVHEGPRIARAGLDAPEAVEVNMIFTIEPGAYVEHVGGVRLEDDVLVTAEGGEVLTAGSRDLLVV